MDITVYRKNRLVSKVAITDETGAALDLEGAALLFVANTSPKISKTIGTGITVTDQTTGEIEIEFTNEDTDVPSGFYKLELVVEDVEGNRLTAATGTLTVLKSIAAQEAV